MTSSYEKLILQWPVIFAATIIPAVIIIAGWVWLGIVAMMLAATYFKTSDFIIRAFQVSGTFKWVLIGIFSILNFGALLAYYLTELFGIGERETINSLIVFTIIPIGIAIGFLWDRKVVRRLQNSQASQDS